MSSEGPQEPAPPQVAFAGGDGGTLTLRVPATPYDPQRTVLYSAAELFDGFDPADPCSYCRTLDARIYGHWRRTGQAKPDDAESLMRRLHDHGITQALEDWVGGRPLVGVMGGHELARTDPDYRSVAELARALTRRGMSVATGGGPGAMEAAHLGARLADKPDEMLDSALDLLKDAPTYKHERWLAAAWKVMSELGDQTPDAAGASVGVPTWLYGHEPPTPFATVIAKYFENSLREDGLVTIATGGIVFAPGSAGTVQELFQDVAQNHYGTVGGLASPMVLMGTDFWTKKRPVLPLLQNLSEGKPYARLITALDDVDDIVTFLSEREPEPVPAADWSFCSAFCGETYS